MLHTLCFRTQTWPTLVYPDNLLPPLHKGLSPDAQRSQSDVLTPARGELSTYTLYPLLFLLLKGEGLSDSQLASSPSWQERRGVKDLEQMVTWYPQSESRELNARVHLGFSFWVRTAVYGMTPPCSALQLTQARSSLTDMVGDSSPKGFQPARQPKFTIIDTKSNLENLT